METLQMLMPLFTAVIAFMAVLTGLGFVFNLLLKPVKENQVRMEEQLDKLEIKIGKIDKLEQDFSDLKSSVEAVLNLWDRKLEENNG